MYQQHVAGQAGRLGDLLLEVEQHVAVLLGVVVGQGVGIDHLVDELNQAEAAVHLWRGLGDDAPRRAAAVAGDVVPGDFQAVLGNREGDGLLEVFQAIAAADHVGLRGIARGGVIDMLGHGRAAACLVDRQAVAVRIALEHGDLPRRQVVLVLLVILRRDGELRLVAGVRVADETVWRHRRSVLSQSAGPGRNGTCSVAGLLRADRRQFVAEAGRLGFGHRSHDVTGQQ